MKINFIVRLTWAAGALAVVGCSSSPSVTGLAIASGSGAALTAVAGDAVPLEVDEQLSDGTQQPLSDSATVTWTSPMTITPLDADSTADSPIPDFGDAPTAAFVDNTLRPDRASDPSGVLYILDPGTRRPARSRSRRPSPAARCRAA